MRKFLFLFLFQACIVTLIAQDKMFLFKSDKTVLGAPISAIDSLVFSSDGSTARLVVGGVYTAGTLRATYGTTANSIAF